MWIISSIEAAQGKPTKGLEIDASMFKTNRGFAVGSLLICGILVALYTLLW
jgi:SSS family solute:Na+ symporter